MRFREVENKPKMRKLFHGAQGVRRAVFGLENDFREQGRGAPALAGYAEFFFEIRVDIGDRFDFHSKDIINARAAFVKRIFFVKIGKVGQNRCYCGGFVL